MFNACVFAPAVLITVFVDLAMTPTYILLWVIHGGDSIEYMFYISDRVADKLINIEDKYLR